ncbi:WXG100 family type VII secretion target [Glycomyces xiaoerkulensis]|uniref:WXG100 family type VII secretion target n=1 Tax=Glycomyces xiaoerkulensis TaxID=2038139 RepID=UPI000C260A54|nr:WXG100 family type VII secretion target [Glycomyces xiaoerkulensis]
MPISMTYAEMESAHKRIIDDQGSINDTLEELATKLDNLEWVGDDLEAYTAKREEWNQSIGRINEILGMVGKAVENAMIRTQETEAANAMRFQ